MHRSSFLVDEHATGGGPAPASRINWTVDAADAWRGRMTAKRTFDVVVAVLLVLATLPILVVAVLASVITLREWPFFVQQRLGHRGAPIPFIKIRTLPSTIPAYALKQNWHANSVPAAMRLLRRLHLDELPQLWLVVSGHLSLVGPRPKMPDAAEPVDPSYGQARVTVPQGCTCLWQIGGDTDTLPSDNPQYDFWYLQYGGLRLDLWILFWTGLQMVGLGEPKTIDDVPAWARSRGWAMVERKDDAVVEMLNVAVSLPERGNPLRAAG